MSKIIKEGKLPVKRMTCDYCGCEFEFDVRDLDKYYSPQGCLTELGLVNNSYDYIVACPCCKVSHKLPANILNQLKAENPRKDFEEDVRALAKQYGLTVKSVEVE